MRAPIVIEAKDSNGNIIPNAVITIRSRVGGTPAFLYENESGGGRENNPLVTDAAGRAVTWAERGVYVASVTGYGITPYDLPIDTTPAGDATVDPAWILPDFPYRAIYNPAAESITSTSYSLLPTPDIITDVTIPANSVVGIGAMFMSKSTATTPSGFATIFANAQKLKLPQPTGAQADSIVAAGNGSAANIYSLSSLESLGWTSVTSSLDFTIETVTGTAMFVNSGSTSGGGMMWLWVPDLGVYDFSLQFQAGAATTLTVKERRLVIWVLG